MVNWGKLIYGGVDSSEYGIYITGEAVYNAPERDVEFVEIPGRNGSIAMDKGRYNNITVTYPAGTFGKTREEFRDALSEFRNAILSQKGYQRLEDSYHPEEYRLAVYTAGLEVSTAAQGQAGEFDLTFECKPQRFLTIGDYPIPVESGATIQNPTVFDSSPLLEVEGYGALSFNGFNISLDNSPLGVVELIPRHSDGSSANFSKTYHFDRSLLDTGDTITVGGMVVDYIFQYAPNNKVYTEVIYSVNPSSDATPTANIGLGGSAFFVTMITPSVTFTALDEDDAEVQKRIGIGIAATIEGASSPDLIYADVYIKCGYDYITYSISTTPSGSVQTVKKENSFQSTPVNGNSTLPILGNPTYIDCEIGDAYRIEDGEYKSSNARVSIGADLPTLSPGANKVTFDNTITNLKIAPRWWKI